MSAENTFYDFLNNLFRKEENLYEFINLLQDSFTSKNDTVSMSFEKDDGTIEEFEVGSVASVLRRVRNLEDNIGAITNVNNLTNASVIGSDGSIKKVFSFDRSGEPKQYLLSEVSSFFKRENYLQHLFVDPYTYLKIDLPKSKYPSYQDVLINKVVLSIGDTEKAEFFANNINNTQINYDELEFILGNADIEYKEVQIETKVETTVYSKRGIFDVISIDDKADITGDSTDESKVYLLDSVFYSDVITNSDVLLKVGDIIYAEDTEYRIDFVSEATNHIGVTRINGYQPITIGTEKLRYLNTAQNPFASVPINKNEFLVVFAKPINPSSRITNPSWGTGMGVNTDELLEGETIKDLWGSFSAVANENLIPASDFIKPEKPTLENDNFNVVVVNDHKETAGSLGEVKQKFAEKIESESNLKMIKEEIVRTNKNIATTDPTDNAKKNELKSKLESLKTKETNASQDVQSRVNELNSVSSALKNFRPKFQIQGFIKGGAEAFDGNKVIRTIGYETEYRYLSKDGKTKENEAINLQEGEFEKKAVVPKWNKMPNPKIREKDQDGNWLDENESSIDEFNINQVTIPITEDEIVEIRTRAISEAGYPLQMNYSDWSDPIRVEFPEDQEENVETILEESRSSLVFNRIIEDLASRGVLRHNDDSVEITETYYAHFLKNIGTSEKTPENKPIDAETFIFAVRERLREVENILAQVSGQVSIRLLNEDESVIAEATPNKTIKFTDEYYKTLIEDLTVKKGAIIDRTMFIEITNLAEGDIEILPFVTGLSDDPMVDSYSGYAFNLTEYNDFRKYWLSPISRLGIQQDAEFLADRPAGNTFIEIEAFQSQQVKGQLVNSRKRDIRLTNILWEEQSTGMEIPVFSATNTQTFIWDGSQTISTPNGNGGLTDFCVHIDHPDLQATSFYMQNFSLYSNSGATRTLPNQTYDNNRVYYPLFAQTLLSSQDDIKQLAYREYNAVNSGATISNFPNKTKFTENDQYLIGSKTCGLYLTLNGDDDLFTDISFAGESKKLKKDERILLPMTASSRLTDYYGSGNSGTGNIGGDLNLTNISYTKKIGIDIVIKSSKLELPTVFSFDFQYKMEYEKSSIN